MRTVSSAQQTGLLTGLIAALLLLPAVAHAQWMPYLWGDEVNAGLSVLAEAETISCKFGPGHITKWSAGSPESEQATFGDDPTVFHSIDLKAGKAMIGGNAGTAEVSAMFTSTGLHFVLVMPNGNVTVTTVYPVKVEPDVKEYIGVDSRQRLSPYPTPKGVYDQVMPSQFHGRCRILSSH
jgi:hypothetical protein